MVTADYSRVIRMSSAAGCRLRTAYTMEGEEPLKQDELAMNIGTFLEPVVVRLLEDKGLATHFAKRESNSEQLEIMDTEPFMVGHPDGLVSLEDDLGNWLTDLLPARAIRLLDIERSVMLLEIKTMNDRTFKQVSSGGLASGAFTASYITQVNTYLGALNEGTIPEALLLLLEERDWQIPKTALVACFSTVTRKVYFEVVEYDKEAYIERGKALEEGLIEPLEAGIWPDPDYNGAAPICFFCPFTHLCPAAQERKEERSFDDVVMAQEETDQLNDLAKKYEALREQIGELKYEQDVVKAQLEDILPVGTRLKTDYYRISRTEVSGRKSTDLDKIAELLDIPKNKLPTKQGNPYPRMTITFLND